MKDAFGKRIQRLFALSSSSRVPWSERKRRLTFETLERRELLDAAPTLAIFDQTARLPLDNLDSVTLTSYLADSTGAPFAPHYGETVYRRIALQNTGDAPLAINSVVASEGSRLEILNQIPESLAPNDETTVLLRWSVLLPETASLTIQTNDPDLPTQVVYFVGAVQTNSLQLPEITSLSLLCDTGSSAVDKITCNPAVVGTPASNLISTAISFPTPRNLFTSREPLRSTQATIPTPSKRPKTEPRLSPSAVARPITTPTGNSSPPAPLRIRSSTSRSVSSRERLFSWRTVRRSLSKRFSLGTSFSPPIT